MLNEVVLAENPFEPDSWESFEVDDVCKFLTTRFNEWPATGRIYHNQVAECNDVTPNDENGIEKLQSLTGKFYCIIYPADGGISIAIAVIAAVAAAAVALTATPNVSAPSIASSENRQRKSANNELSERKNEPRPNARIPDIFGQVRATPDLISVPYATFENNQEVEHSYMCLGRGAYEVEDVRDGSTLVSDIAGTSVEVYAPDTSPNSGDSPQLTIGTPIGETLINTTRSNSVNGQVLRAPNDVNVVGDENIKFGSPNEIRSDVIDLDMTDKFETGDTIIVTNSDCIAHVVDTITDPPNTIEYDVPLNFDGTYTVLAVSNDTVVLDNPAAVNSDWTTLAGLGIYGTTETEFASPTLETSGPKWVGPFTLDRDDTEEVYINAVATNGMYKDNGNTQIKTDVVVELELTPVDSGGTPTGPAETFQTTIEGSATLTSQRAETIKANPTFTGRCEARMRRITEADLAFSGTVVDEVKWRDMYAVVAVSENDFGNVTTVQTLSYATAGALLIKERKLNMLATRKIPQRISGDTFTTTLHATTRADEIISELCLDEFIGNRDKAEIDFDSIYDTVSEIETYFGTDLAASFSYTFDSDNLSFEETISSVTGAIFSLAYRRGNVIKLSFEKETEDSTLLFNHRNKLPGSETRTVNFGYTNDNDGVELDYISPDDDSVKTIYLPDDQSAVNPKKVETIGVRSNVQAHFHAWRIWNKTRYGNMTVEFEGTQEADLLVIKDRILVTDNTRPDTQDGEVLAQNGLVLTVSQPLVFEDGVTYVAFLQLSDETVESIPVVAGSSEYEMILEYAPSLPLATDKDLYAKTTYMLVGNNDVRPTAFLVEEKDAQDSFTSIITASKYDSRFYDHDTDFINLLVVE